LNTHLDLPTLSKKLVRSVENEGDVRNSWTFYKEFEEMGMVRRRRMRVTV